MVFFSVILQFAKGESKAWCAFPIAVALMGAILFGGKISGGHFNPAVTVMDLVNRQSALTQSDYTTALAYIVAQVLAGIAAVFAVKYCTSK
tara:strand:+ start:2040 stop:2312 length:273 start_codon:yes stop_codon:yes gene_type:complete